MKNNSYLCSRKSIKKKRHTQIFGLKNEICESKTAIFCSPEKTPYLLTKNNL